nr:DNA topoisomerase 1-like [Tanacetum cinerariifolium]
MADPDEGGKMFVKWSHSISRMAYPNAQIIVRTYILEKAFNKIEVKEVEGFLHQIETNTPPLASAATPTCSEKEESRLTKIPIVMRHRYFFSPPYMLEVEDDQSWNLTENAFMHTARNETGENSLLTYPTDNMSIDGAQYTHCRNEMSTQGIGAKIRADQYALDTIALQNLESGSFLNWAISTGIKMADPDEGGKMFVKWSHSISRMAYPNAQIIVRTYILEKAFNKIEVKEVEGFLHQIETNTPPLASAATPVVSLGHENSLFEKKQGDTVIESIIRPQLHDYMMEIDQRGCVSMVSHVVCEALQLNGCGFKSCLGHYDDDDDEDNDCDDDDYDDDDDDDVPNQKTKKQTSSCNKSSSVNQKVDKKALREEKMKLEEKYTWAIVDGVKEKVGNSRVEGNI